jgi:hypothetical protein
MNWYRARNQAEKDAIRLFIQRKVEGELDASQAAHVAGLREGTPATAPGGGPKAGTSACSNAGQAGGLSNPVIPLGVASGGPTAGSNAALPPNNPSRTSIGTGLTRANPSPTSVTRSASSPINSTVSGGPRTAPRAATRIWRRCV